MPLFGKLFNVVKFLNTLFIFELKLLSLINLKLLILSVFGGGNIFTLFKVGLYIKLLFTKLLFCKIPWGIFNLLILLSLIAIIGFFSFIFLLSFLLASLFVFILVFTSFNLSIACLIISS